MLSDSLRFDDRSRTSLSDQPIPLGGVPRALRNAAESTGLDAISELYNEAITYATEGHLRLARERLQVLLALAPDDGEARLLLAKVHVAGQKWREALSALDEAASCGQEVPYPLRRAVEDHLRAEEAAKDEQRAATVAREQGEIKALRQEARRLRSENAQLLGRNGDLERESKKWAWITAGVSGMAILFIGGNLIFGGRGAESTVAPEATGDAAVWVEPGDDAVEAVDEGTADDAVETEPPPAVEGNAITARAANRLSRTPGLDKTELEVHVDKGVAWLGGSANAVHEVKTAERALMRMKGVKRVESGAVTVLALTKGTKHKVKKGDTLSHISLKYYGTSKHTKAIQRANKMKGKTSLTVGDKLVIPAVN